MTCITEPKMVCREVDHTHEHRDKHTLLIVFRQGLVDACTDICWFLALGGKGTEQSRNLCHKERGGHTLT